jgi:subtilisin family serine protease
MRHFTAILSLLLASSALFSQFPAHYFVAFKDKEGTSFSVENPAAFLSEDAIQRRKSQGIIIDKTDLPVSQKYLSKVISTGAAPMNVLKWINGTTVTVHSIEELIQIESLPCVESVKFIDRPDQEKSKSQSKSEPVITLNYVEVDSTPYAASYHQIHMLNAEILHAYGFRGAGMKVAVFDAGFIQADTLNFFSKMRAENRMHPVWDFVADTPYVFHNATHGMNVLSILGSDLPGKMIGSAPDADYYLFVTEDENSETLLEEYNWAAAAEKADSIGADVFSTSLGYTQFNDTATSHTYADMNGSKTVITKAANAAARKGILVINSAGNEGNHPWHYISAPADGDSVLAIGAVDAGRVLAPFSSRGPNSAGMIRPNVCAQGKGTAIAYANNLPAYSNGTSFSCPLLAGAATCLWQAFPHKTSMEIFYAVQEAADRYDHPDSNYGYGIPDFLLAFQRFEHAQLDSIDKSSFPFIYPNPFNNNATLLWYAYDTEDLDISITDMKGSIVCRKTLSVAKDSYSHILLSDLDQLQAGDYILRVQHAGKNYVRKLMKQ